MASDSEWERLLSDGRVHAPTGGPLEDIEPLELGANLTGELLTDRELER